MDGVHGTRKDCSILVGRNVGIVIRTTACRCIDPLPALWIGGLHFQAATIARQKGRSSKLSLH
jgi:hypothetical protein